MATDSFGLTGEGIIVGIVDQDIDVYNDDFSETIDTSKTRILYLFKAADSTGTSPYNYGTEYTKSDIDNLSLPGTELYEHGTKVLGIAAGNGARTKDTIPYGTFQGMAPEASIIVVDGYDLFYDDVIIDGINYIVNKAYSLGMPCAINLSLGRLQGPKDGTSLFEQTIDNIASDIGVIVVVSAGNCNYDPNITYPVSRKDQRIHARSLSYGYPTSGDTLELLIDSDSTYTTFDKIMIELWYPLVSSDFYFTIRDPSGHFDSWPSYGPGTGIPSPGRGLHTHFGVIAIHNEHYKIGEDPYPYSYGHVFIYISDDSSSDWHDCIESGTWKIIADSGQGMWDAYIYHSNRDSSANEENYFENYDNNYCIKEPGNGNCVITVGSFNDKQFWLGIDGNYNSEGDTINHPLGDTSHFSSRGPTRDGRNKPDILAPGSMIATSISDSLVDSLLNAPLYGWKYLDYDTCHYNEEGTSFAAPHITGLAALMLQVDPDIDYMDVLYCLQSTSIGGKVDAYGALECIGAVAYPGMCGDANKDGMVNISDGAYLINYVFSGGPDPLPVLACGDTNTDTRVNISDAVYMINYVFSGGNPPGDCSPGEWSGQGGDCPPFSN